MSACFDSWCFGPIENFLLWDDLSEFCLISKMSSFHLTEKPIKEDGFPILILLYFKTSTFWLTAAKTKIFFDMRCKLDCLKAVLKETMFCLSNVRRCKAEENKE